MRDEILTLLQLFSNQNNLDLNSLMESFYKVITKEIDNNLLLDNFLEILSKKYDMTIVEIEERLFYIISDILIKNYEKDVIDDNIKIKVWEFLDEFYYDLHYQYYTKNNSLSESDYNDTVLSVFNKFFNDLEICDIYVGKWIEEKIIK